MSRNDFRSTLRCGFLDLKQNSMRILRQKEFANISSCDQMTKVGNIITKGINNAIKNNKTKVAKPVKKALEKSAKAAQGLTGDRVNSAKVDEGVVVKLRGIGKEKSKSINDPNQRSLFKFHRDPDPVIQSRVKRAPRVGWRSEKIRTGKVGEKVERVMTDGSIKTYQTGQTHLPFIETDGNIYI